MLKQYHVVQMSGYWQFQFDDITIDGKKTGTCGLLPCLRVLAVVFAVQKMLHAVEVRNLNNPRSRMQISNKDLPSLKVTGCTRKRDC